MLSEIICLIFDQVDEYELFTSPESLIEWLNKYNIRPADVVGKVIVHYKDNPRIPVPFDLLPFTEERPVNEKELQENVEIQWAAHIRFMNSIPPESRRVLDTTKEEINKKEFLRLKFKFKDFSEI